MSDLYVAHVL